jgi:integrase/recombinase XerD
MASPTNPDLYKPVSQWFPANQGCYGRFRRWLQEASYSESAVNIYSCAARLVFSQVDKPYWQMNEADLEEVRNLIAVRFDSAATRQGYGKGLLKLAEFLRQRLGQPRPPKTVNWSYFLDGLPDWLAEAIRGYLRHRQRAWLPDRQYELAGSTLGRLTYFLQWAAKRTTLNNAAGLTPELWYTYLDERLAAGITSKTVNGELSTVQGFLYYWAELGQPVCDRLLRVKRLKEDICLPRDAPVAQLRQVYAAIEAAAQSDHAGVRRAGVMDRAIFLLMLHSGLRTGEMRRLQWADLDMDGQRARIEQSKGLKDRVVYLSPAVIAALEAYRPLRGPVDSDHVFICRHRPLSVTYWVERLRTYGKRCGYTIHPHQLRHSCATLLLNAGAPILTVQTLLGHRHLDTTLGYARLYDGTVAADYYRAMAQVEQRLELTPAPEQPTTEPAQLVALVDALSNGTLNDSQRELVHALRSGILALAEQNSGANVVDAEAVSG